MYCSKCQRIIENAEAAFCPECGSPLIPAPFAGEMPQPGATQATDALETETGPLAGLEADASAAADTDETKPESVQPQTTRIDYSTVSPNSDTAAFAVVKESSTVNTVPQVPPVAPVLSPPPLRTGSSQAKVGRKSAAASKNGEGVPLALIVVAVILAVLVGGFAFFWFYFDLEAKDIKDIFKVFSTERSSASDMVLPEPEPHTGGSSGLSTSQADPDTGDGSSTPAVAPTPVPRAEPTDSTVVLRNAHPNGRLLVDGVETPFEYVGNDIVVQRSDLPDVCQVRLIAENNGTYETAAVWFNYHYGNELSFADDYGDYVLCDESGLGVPSTKVIDVLLWAYHESFLRAINEQSTSYLRYSTEKNTYAENDHVYSTTNARNTYDLDDFHAGCDPDSVTYSNDGKVTLNATFVSYATNRKSGKRAEVLSRKTMELVWEDGMWKVNRLAFVNDTDYAAGRYADLP